MLATTWGIRWKALGLVRVDTLPEGDRPLGNRIRIATAARSAAAGGLTVGWVLT